MDGWAHFLIHVEKLLRTAEAQCTLEMFKDARASMESMKGLLAEAQAATWMQEEEKIRLRYKQKGMSVTVSQRIGEAVMLEFTDDE